ncbi:MAG: RidA family protein [Thermomicrobiales bacterium]
MTKLRASNPSTVAPPMGPYSQSVQVPANARWLVTAGQIGVRPDGTIPEGNEAQHEQDWQNTLAHLADAGMGPENLVRHNVYSTDPEGLKFVKAHRDRFLSPDHTPASTWLVVSALASPDLLVEMETIAAKAD